MSNSSIFDSDENVSIVDRILDHIEKEKPFLRSDSRPSKTRQKAEHHPLLIILMGVSGCGKSTLASRIAHDFGYEFIEADDFHSVENKTHMANGHPLTDDMRAPWIDALVAHLQDCHKEGKSCVMAYSGLRKSHRQRFRQAGYPTLYVHLKGSKELISQRLSARVNHFMSPDLLESQFQSLEPTCDESDIVEVQVTPSIDELANKIEKLVDGFRVSQTK